MFSRSFTAFSRLRYTVLQVLIPSVRFRHCGGKIIFYIPLYKTKITAAVSHKTVLNGNISIVFYWTKYAKLYININYISWNVLTLEKG